jgi:glycosyltransferase involved in cell wall biosynthesis
MPIDASKVREADCRSQAATLAGAIERLFDEIGLAQRLGERGFQRAKELFSIEKNVRSLLALIDPDNNYA